MAKYDWIALEKEYILSEYKSVSAFLKDKGINNNGTTRKHTSGWKDKKRQKEDKKATKIVEKVIEKQSTKDANAIVKINDVANKLLSKIMDANINDNNDIKKLTSALRDLKDIIPQKQEEEEDNSFVEALNGKVEDIWNEKK